MALQVPQVLRKDVTKLTDFQILIPVGLQNRQILTLLRTLFGLLLCCFRGLGLFRLSLPFQTHLDQLPPNLLSDR